MLDTPKAENQDLLNAAIDGLSATPKHLSPKWFYDQAGSVLFEEITQLPEYYPTRTETAILKERVGELGSLLDDQTALVELGSGASVKTRILLDGLPQLTTYVPLDISAQFLGEIAGTLATDYPQLTVSPMVADFMAEIDLPAKLEQTKKLVFFPGSTIGNLERSEALALLSRLRKWPNVSAFVLGIDLVKDTQTLISAYDDSAGVTARFNKNLLVRLNREAQADFNLDAFAHEARWNVQLERIEMHLVSLTDQEVKLGGRSFKFAIGESLHTENSHKYSAHRLREMATKTGWSVAEFWTDERQHFAVAILIPDGQII